MLASTYFVSSVSTTTALSSPSAGTLRLIVQLAIRSLEFTGLTVLDTPISPTGYGSIPTLLPSLSISLLLYSSFTVLFRYFFSYTDETSVLVLYLNVYVYGLSSLIVYDQLLSVLSGVNISGLAVPSVGAGVLYISISPSYSVRGLRSSPERASFTVTPFAGTTASLLTTTSHSAIRYLSSTSSPLPPDEDLVIGTLFLVNFSVLSS